MQRHLQKLTNVTQLSFAERALLSEHNQILGKISNEAKARRATKSKILGKARVMSYEDLEQARVARAAKDAKKQASKKTRKSKKAEKELTAETKAEQTSTGKRKRGGNGKSNMEEGTAEPVTEMAHTCGIESEGNAIISVPWQAPVAKMW